LAGALEGKVSIITGGASGMGRSTALLFAREGAAVVVSDVNDAGGEATVATIRDTGGQALFVHADTSNEDQVVNLVAQAAKTFGRVDSMVTAAGVSYAAALEGDESTDPFLHPDVATILNKPTDRWRRVIDINLMGVMLCGREAARQMVAEGHGGTIVNFSSIAGYNPSPTIADYCVSKAGVIMLTRCMAAEFGRYGIRVNAVAPGPIETAMTESLIRIGRLQQQAAMLPLGRIGQPEEVSNVILFLSSDQSSYVTGKTLGVDGGTNTV
jgi:NAD(P)-dependent dehydrogenase (short-subunit alcohol dehydrogenase family)